MRAITAPRRLHLPRLTSNSLRCSRSKWVISIELSNHRSLSRCQGAWTWRVTNRPSLRTAYISSLQTPHRLSLTMKDFCQLSRKQVPLWTLWVKVSNTNRTSTDERSCTAQMPPKIWVARPLIPGTYLALLCDWQGRHRWSHIPAVECRATLLDTVKTIEARLN